jgi:adenine C2-methylase RlmN of 23S rRNA A2503 and tRNA A37
LTYIVNNVIINLEINKEVFKMEEIKKQLEEAGYDYAVAIATEAEIKNGAACGQLAIIVENEE